MPYLLLCKAREAVDTDTPAAFAISSKVVDKGFIPRNEILCNANVCVA
jgi:hypothetical protein